MATRQKTKRDLLVQPLALVETEELEWAWNPVIPKGVLTLLAGRAGIGKSIILAWLVSAFTQGNLEGNLRGVPVPVTFVAGEDDIARVLKPRLEAAGANITLVSSISLRQTEDDGSQWVSMPNVRQDLDQLREAIVETGTQVLIIDPLSATLEGDTNSEQVVRAQLGRLATLADELNIAVIAVKHWHKGQGASIDRISGSHGFTDMVRSVLQLMPDEENGTLVLTVDKGNYSQTKPSYEFRIDTVEVETSAGSSNLVGRAVFLGESETRVEDILARAEEPSLGDLSTRVLKFVGVSGEVTADEVADNLAIEVHKARTYLNRLVNSGRLERAGRGRFQAPANDTAVPSVSNVMGVSFGFANDTDMTLDTLETGVL